MPDPRPDPADRLVERRAVRRAGRRSDDAPAQERPAAGVTEAHVESAATGPGPGGATRSPEQRAADHRAIDRLADNLLPALVAKLGATGLGEIELREDGWRLRVRRPSEGPNLGRRATDRPSRAQPGHAGHGHAPAALEGHRSARPATQPQPAGQYSTNGSGPTSPPVGVSREEPAERGRRRHDPDAHRAVATSPAVGIFQPRTEVRAGSRVRAGDRIGSVDMLGVAQEVVAPADGIVGASLVDSGQAVEYGQELVVIELVTPPAGEAGSRSPSGSA